MEGLAPWCSAHLGAEPVSEIFRSGHLSEVVGVELADGRKVVVKVRPQSDRLAAVFAVQRDLNERGFPCAAPLAGPSPFGDLAATAEEYVPRRGEPPSPPPAEASAELLARLVALAPPASRHAALAPAPPWVGWDHDGHGTWPWPDDLTVDLNVHAGPDWVDAAAHRLRDRLASAGGEPRIGHADWEAHNLDWSEGEPVLVHDWDSLAIRAEPAIAGAAATVFPSAVGGPVAAHHRADRAVPRRLSAGAVAMVSRRRADGVGCGTLGHHLQRQEGDARRRRRLPPAPRR